MRKAAGSFAVRGLGAVAAFSLQVVIARLLGAEGAGLYFTCLSIIVLTSVVGRAGLDVAMLRFVSSFVARQDWRAAHGVLLKAATCVFVLCLLLGIALFAFSSPLAVSVMSEPRLAPFLQAMVPGLLGVAMLNVLAESLKGAGRVISAMAVSSLFYPSIGLLLIWPLVTQYGPKGAALSYAIATCLTALLGAWLWLSGPQVQLRSYEPFPLRHLWRSARHLWVMSIFNVGILPWGPLILLSLFSAPSEVGIFGAAVRMSILLAFLLQALNSALVPRFAHFLEQDQLAKLQDIARRSTLIITMIGLPIVLVFTLFGSHVMALFGPEFRAGGLVLGILTMGRAINIMTGSVGYLLIQTGHERDVRDASITACVLMILTGLLFIPPFGMIGAALAAALAEITTNLYATYRLWQRTGLVIIPFLPKRNFTNDAKQ